MTTADASDETQAAASRRGRPPKDPGPRRERIIDAACDLFISQGYSETTIEAVSKAAGLNKRTIYNLVGDKEELFRAVCQHSYAMIGDDSLQITAHSGSLEERLVSIAQTILDHALSDRTVALERTVLAEHRRFPRLVEELTSLAHTEGNQKISQFFAGLQKSNIMPEIDVHAASELFYDTIAGQLSFRKIFGYEEPIDPNYVLQRVRFFMRGYWGLEPGD